MRTLLPGSVLAQWQLLMGLAWSNFLLHLGTQALNPLAPLVVTRFSIGPAGWGLLLTASAAAAALGSIPGGWLGDRFSLRVLALFGAVALATSFAFAAVASNYTWFLLSVAGSGLAAGMCLPAVNRAVVDSFGVSRRGLAMGMKQSLVSLLGAASASTLALSAASFGLGATLGGLAVVIFGSGVLVALRLSALLARTTTIDRGSVAIGRLRPTGRNQFALAAATFFMGAAQTTFAGYLMLYLYDSVGTSFAVAGLGLSVAYLAGAAGRLAWAGMSDLVLAGRRKTPLLAIATLTATAASVLAMVGGESALPQWATFALAATLGLAVFGWYGVALTALGEAGRSGHTATAIGRGLTLAFLGQSSGPLLFGAVVDVTGEYAAGWMMFAGWAAAAAVLILLVRED